MVLPVGRCIASFGLAGTGFLPNGPVPATFGRFYSPVIWTRLTNWRFGFAFLAIYAHRVEDDSEYGRIPELRIDEMKAEDANHQQSSACRPGMPVSLYSHPEHVL